MAIVEFREKHLKDYMKVCAYLIPRDAKLDVSVEPSPEFKLALASFASDYCAVRDAVLRIGASPTVLDAIDIDDEA